MQSSTRNNVLNISFTFILSGLIVFLSLLAFLSMNAERIENQNKAYLASSIQQTQRRLDDMVNNAMGSMQTIADVFADMGVSDENAINRVLNEVDDSSFDFFFFVDSDGFLYLSDGDMKGNVSGRDYFDKAMKGESGIQSLNGEDFILSDDNAIVFYTPLVEDGEAIGLIAGTYGPDTVEQYLSTDLFGVDTPTFLCSGNGTVLAQSGEEHEGTAIDSVVSDDMSGMIDTDDGISHQTTKEDGHAYVARLGSYDLYVVSMFPASITDKMIFNSNIAGFMLVAGVVLAGIVFMVVLTARLRKRNHDLTADNKDLTDIINASTSIFDKFIRVDVTSKRYEYINQGEDNGIPSHGRFFDLKTYWEETAIGDSKEAIAKDMSLQSILKRLREKPSFYGVYLMDVGGEERWVQMNVVTISADDNGVTKFLVTKQDVTASKKKEQEVNDALIAACAASENASKAKSDFLNNMSHDIRTPMNSIMGMTTLAKMHSDDPNYVRDCLDNIHSSSTHLLSLINEVLDMAKIESGSITLSKEPFNFSDVIEGVVSVIMPQSSAKKQSLKVDVKGVEHESYIGDVTRLQQVLMNLLGNAVKFTPEGGSISVKVKETRKSNDMSVLRFVVSDTGCGMSKEFLERVFDPFSRAEDTRTTKEEGTGLGLSIVHSIVELMSGVIDVVSTEGVGTTFTVDIPLQVDECERVDSSKLQGKRILVVDDDLEYCLYAVEIAKEIGLDADFKISGEDALAEVTKRDSSGEQYDFLLLDWCMPGLSGLEVVSRIKKEIDPAIPVIIVSGYDRAVVERESSEVLYDAFITKPLFKSKVTNALLRLVDGNESSIDEDEARLLGIDLTNKRILLVEDNEMAAQIAVELIGMTGAEVHREANGKDAVDHLTENEDGHYDLVLMDMQMPVMNGYQATEEIRKLGEEREYLSKLPIVALTADAFSDDVLKAEQAGMNAHLSKPLEIAKLTDLMQKLLLD